MVELTLTQGVLLKKAVALLVFLAEKATISYSPEGLSLIASDTNRLVIVSLRIGSSGFHYYRCHEDITAGVDLGHLYQILSVADDGDSVTIHGDAGEVVSGFVFQNARTHEYKYAEMALMEVNDDFVAPIELQYGYKVVIGIPSEEFRNIIMRLNYFGETVFITATDKQVKFCTVNEEIILNKERGKCIIGGAEAEDPVSMVFSFYHASSFLNASLMSNAVWIFQSNDVPSLLNCPVGALGNIMFYFV